MTYLNAFLDLPYAIWWVLGIGLVITAGEIWLIRKFFRRPGKPEISYKNMEKYRGSLNGRMRGEG